MSKFSHSDALAKKFESFGYISRGEYGEVPLEGVGRDEAEEDI